ncbi:MAG: sodium/solute symporter [Bacteroidetes bacterium]|jgi:solute:Na+ symporter, SSS family|nr:sodium/solute symporter [Bacteroidota bacterium]MBT3750437.1 sodium/solute symporter [Bacteroidota bacterium]MBT4397861.1 sodium/solute symporter [Bacteroidota bacterium]MBT5426231.1 sodium/solute symporter [Bacteroidota bacterium]MBT7091787.1 sodium/solute symporter [Bacteroidota bacterium]
MISPIDAVIIVVYLVGILTIGILSVKLKNMSSERYFLAGRGLKWPVIGAALFASNISTIHLVGLAASGYNEGLVWGNFEWLAAITLILLGLVFAPFYFKSKISTLPEFMEKRYGQGARTVLAIIAIIGALFVHIGMSLYAGAVVFHAFFGIPVMVSILIISVVTIAYTVLGGLKAVVVTETIQTGILIIGALILTIIAAFALPDKGIHTLADLKAVLKPGQLNILHTQDSLKALGEGGFDSGLTWYACLLGYPILGLWYWCSDQTIVQRVLGAKTMRDAQTGPIFAGFLKILPVFILVLPGVFAYALFPDIIGTDANQTLPVLINQLLPVGLKGIMAATLLAALMSTIAAALNSSATLVALDIVKRIKPETSDKQQVKSGRVAAIVVMALAMLWSTQGDQFSSIFEAINKIASAIAPPVAVVFLFGVFSKKGTYMGAMVTLILGLALGITAFCFDFEPISGYMYLTHGWHMPFMMQAWWLFVICSIIYFLVSWFTKKPSSEVIEKYTWKNPLAVVLSGKINKWTDPRVLALMLVVVLITLYIIF